MTKDILEKAYEKSKEIEEKQLKRMQLAGAVGTVLGAGVAILLDTTVFWLIAKYLVGFSISWVAVLGYSLAFSMIMYKVKAALK